jgi:hypothetical protein
MHFSRRKEQDQECCWLNKKDIKDNIVQDAFYLMPYVNFENNLNSLEESLYF